MAGSEESAGSSKTRCYWAVLDTSMTFQYLDPLLQEHMREQASAMLGKSLVDFIHPEEQPVAQDDFAKFKTHTSVFGSVTRCRYAQVSQCRRILGAEDVKDDVTVNGSDDKWVATKITSSLIALNAVLAFFHSMPDGEGEPDEANNCGPAVVDASKDYMTPTQVELLQKALSKCQSEATDDMRQNVAAVKQAQHMSSNGVSPPMYTFQLLDTNTDAVYFSWPPSKPTGDEDDRNTHGTASDGEERYSPQEYAALAKSVSLPQPPAGDTTETNCTRRYQSKHPVLFDNSYVNVESVVITYRSLTIVCFQSGGIFLNRNIFAAVAPPLPADDGKRKHDSFSDLSEHEAIKRLRTANLQLDDQNTPVPSNLDLSQWQSSDANNQSGQFGNMGNNTQVPQSWGNDDPNNLQSPYYNAGGSYPNVYSNMFSNDGRNGGFMGGSTTIPPMPAPSQPTNSNGLNNLALASSSNYYSDFNPNNFNVDGSANPQSAGNEGSGNESPAIDGSNTDEKGVVIHRVRKNDRGRMCTSCGTTNSPEWRKGPSGIKTLCNACGLRYSRAQARKAKKAAKEAEAAAGGGNYSTNGNNMSQDNISTSYNIPTPLQIPNSASTVPGGPGSAGTPHSPYLPIGDYSVHSALPPLPQSTHDDGSQTHSAGTNGSVQNNDQNSFGSYGNFVNFNFAGQWGNASPTGNQSFAQQQGQ